MIKACIFDCDGTLLDTLVSIGSSANRALEDYGFEPIPIPEYKKLVGDGAQELIRRCLKRCKDEACAHYDEVYKRYREYFKEGCRYEVKAYEGIGELLAELKKTNIRIAVLSNKPHEHTVDVIRDCFGETVFDVVLGAKPELARKPAPDGALVIMRELGTKAQECLYIGDTDTDMQTGNAAGMHTVGVLWGFRDREELKKNHAEYIAEHPHEILMLAESL